MSQQQQQQQTQRPALKKSQTPEFKSVKMTYSTTTTEPLLIRPSFPQASKQGSHLRSSVVPKGSPLVKQSSTQNKPWTLCHPLPAIPAGYMLERNKITVPHTNQTPQEIANRVAHCLQLRSMAITPTERDIKNGIRAESHQGLLFSINFFQDPSTEDSTVLEFQRVAGCSYQFQRAFQAVHRTIVLPETNPTTTSTTPSRELDAPSCCVLPNSASTAERAVETFQIAMEMMQSDRIDSQLLGLECLEPLSVNPDVLPLLFSNESNSFQTLLNFCAVTDEPRSALEHKHDCLIKRRALSILANGLEQLSSIPSMTSAPQVDVLLETLLACLNNHQQPQDAHQQFQVARCLVELAKSSARSQALLIDADVMHLLLSSSSEPSTRLLALDQECQKLETILSSH